MIVECGGCGSKIRVPDEAAGKRVKCPKCATTLAVPTAGTSIAPTSPPPSPMAPPPVPPPLEAAPPPVPPPSHASAAPQFAIVDDFVPAPEPLHDDDDRPPRRYRNDRDDEDVRPRRSRSHDDYDDRDDLRSVRRREQPSTGMALTSMILGIVSLALAFLVFCCGIFAGLPSWICSVLAIIFGCIGMNGHPSGKGMATTGLICGGVALLLSIGGFIALVFFVTSMPWRWM